MDHGASTLLHVLRSLHCTRSISFSFPNQIPTVNYKAGHPQAPTQQEVTSDSSEMNIYRGTKIERERRGGGGTSTCDIYTKKK